jgi:dipeptidyl aminopeptidase/acylaminoacyl peptidase
LDGDMPPFMIVHGLTDAVIPPEDSQQLYAAMIGPGTDVQLALVPDVDHLSILEGHSGQDKLLRVIDPFLARLAFGG